MKVSGSLSKIQLDLCFDVGFESSKFEAIRCYFYSRLRSSSNCDYNKIQDTRAGLPQFLGWPEVLISFSLTQYHSAPRHYTSCRGVSPTSCVSPAKAVPIRSLVTGRLGIEPGTLRVGGEREATTPPSRL